MTSLLNLLRSVTRSLGVDVVRYRKGGQSVTYPPDFTEEDIDVIRRVQPYTYTSPERIVALCNATRHIVDNRVVGAFVECGVWKGGSMMAAMLTLQSLQDTSRECFLYDTYEGMTEPTEKDTSFTGKSAKHSYDEITQQGGKMTYSSLEEVKGIIGSVGYPAGKVHYVKGKVEETIPAVAPESIALLRLDTDWYESTRHELVHLYPRLSAGGVIIIDDYGHWAGARQATDEYFRQNGIRLLLNRIDYTGRIGVKA